MKKGKSKLGSQDAMKLLEENLEMWKRTRDKKNKRVCVPISFVIETTAEFHDHFKHILVMLYKAFM